MYLGDTATRESGTIYTTIPQPTALFLPDLHFHNGMRWATHNRLLDQADELDAFGCVSALSGLVWSAGWMHLLGRLQEPA